MALNPVGLGTGVAAWFVSEAPDLSTGATNLANVFRDYYQAIVGPIITATGEDSGHNECRNAFRDEFIEQMSANRTSYDKTWPFLIASVEAYVAKMVEIAENPETDEVLEPTVPLLFDIPATTQDPATPAAHIATVVQAWSITGTVVPPSGTAVPWS